jgi:hypothetical protein
MWLSVIRASLAAISDVRSSWGRTAESSLQLRHANTHTRHVWACRSRARENPVMMHDASYKQSWALPVIRRFFSLLGCGLAALCELRFSGSRLWRDEVQPLRGCQIKRIAEQRRRRIERRIHLDLRQQFLSPSGTKNGHAAQGRICRNHGHGIPWALVPATLTERFVGAPGGATACGPSRSPEHLKTHRGSIMKQLQRLVFVAPCASGRQRCIVEFLNVRLCLASFRDTSTIPGSWPGASRRMTS